MHRKQVLSLFMMIMGAALLVADDVRRCRLVGYQEGGLGGGEEGRNTPRQPVELGLRLRRSAARLPDRRLVDDLHDVDAARRLPGEGRRSGQRSSSRSGPTSFPTVSKNGTVYTFHVRPGLKFSDGSPVTAAAYQRSWERILSPKMGSPLGVNLDLQKDIVGADAFLAGKAAHISGISAKGLTLTFHLTHPNATFVSILSMQWFTAGQAEHAVRRQGRRTPIRPPARTTSPRATRAARRC